MARAQIASGDLCFALARLRGAQVSQGSEASAAPRENFGANQINPLITTQRRAAMVRRLNARASGFEGEFATLVESRREEEHDVAQAVATIIADVRARGDAALIEYSRRFDGVELSPGTLTVSESEITAAEQQCADDVRKALHFAAQRIEAYHRRQVPADASFTDETGTTLGWRWGALDAVGIYVPGGTASYPSSVLMNAVPARVAGVRRIAMVTPASRV